MITLAKAIVGNKELRIVLDENGESPREWDNLGTMICWHGHYNLGDKHEFKTPQDFQQYIKTQKIVILPIYMYEHSGITISCSRNYPFDDTWDAGQIGYIYVTHEKLKQEFKKKYVTKKLEHQAVDTLLAEVKTYDQYLRNDVYGFVIVEKRTCDKCQHTNETVLNSCFGFYGTDWKENGLLEDAGKEWKNATIEECE